MKSRLMWILVCICTFILVFLGSAYLKLNPPFASDPHDVEWDESVGSIYTDLEYGDEELNNFDLYVPADNSRDSYGLIVYLHAGGFTMGDKSDDATILKYFASKGYVAAGINYSLSSEENSSNLNIMSEEIKQSIPIVKKKSEELGYNLDAMAVSGGSAGGSLALLYAYKDADESEIPLKFVYSAVGSPNFDPSKWLGLDSSFNLEEEAEAGAVFASIMTGENISIDMMRSGEYKKYVDKISPYAYVSEDSVPSLVAYGTHDKLVPFITTKEYKEALENYNVPHDFIEFEKSGHGLQNEPKKTKLLNEKLDEYLEKYMPLK